MARIRPGLADVAPGRLHVSPLNDQTRTIDPDERERLKHAMRQVPEHLRARPLIVDSADGAIIGGRHRWEVAVELLDEDDASPFKREFKDGKLPTYARRFRDDDERIEWLTRDNADYAGWVPDEVAVLVKRHQDNGGDAQLLGFPGEEITDLLERLAEPSFTPDDPGPRLDTRLTRSVTCPECEHTFEISAVETSP
jgi:hypothetical protein